jgi:hypothetical protein
MAPAMSMSRSSSPTADGARGDASGTVCDGVVRRMNILIRITRGV